jgi:hypothetical protein
MGEDMMRFPLALLAAVVLLPTAGYAADPPSGSTCSVQALQSDPTAVGKLSDMPTVAVAPAWTGDTAAMLPSGQPITLHITFPTDLPPSTTPTFAIAGKLADDTNATWQSYPVLSWQRSTTAAKSGDIVLPAVPDDNVSPAYKTRLDLVVAACNGGANPVIGKTRARVSPHCSAVIIALAITVFFYVVSAVAIKGAIGGKVHFNPLWLAIDGSGRASLSQMQIIFFSVIVLFLVSYILLRTGILASLSQDVLLLLGIAGAGSVGGQLATNSTQRISFDNWAWIKQKNWTTDGGFHVEKPKWADLFTTNDVFDPYRFQMVSFSFVIGIALLIIGVNGLANFSIPTALLGVIGLSQVTYLGGKISAPATFSQLDDKLTAARKAQDDFLKATSPRWVTPAITAAEKAARLQAARLDGRDTYLAFRSLICPAYEMFKTLYTSRGQQPNLEPDPTC